MFPFVEEKIKWDDYGEIIRYVYCVLLHFPSCQWESEDASSFLITPTVILQFECNFRQQNNPHNHTFFSVSTPKFIWDSISIAIFRLYQYNNIQNGQQFFRYRAYIYGNLPATFMSPFRTSAFRVINGQWIGSWSKTVFIRTNKCVLFSVCALLVG